MVVISNIKLIYNLKQNHKKKPLERDLNTSLNKCQLKKLNATPSSDNYICPYE